MTGVDTNSNDLIPSEMLQRWRDERSRLSEKIVGLQHRLETLDKLLEAGGELARLDNVVQPLEPKEGDAMASSKAPTSAPVPPEQPDRKERNWTATVSTPEKAEQS